MLTKKQLAARAMGIGASEIAALAGLSRWQKPIDIYLAKTTPPDPNAVNLAMELGDLLEEPIAQLAARRRGFFLRKVDTLSRPDKPRALATPDRAAFATREARGDARAKIRFAGELTESVGLIQCKHTSMRLRHEWGEPETDNVPDYFYPQAIWEGGVSGVRLVTFAVLFDKREFGMWPVPFRLDLFEGLYEIADRFFTDHVLPLKPPPPDASDRYADFLNSKFPSSNGQLIAPSVQLEEKIFRWAMVKVCRDRATELAKQLGNELKAELGQNYGFEGPRFGKVLWLRPKPSTQTDWKAATNDLMLLVPRLAEEVDPAKRAELLKEAHGVVEKHTAPRFNAPKLQPYFKKGSEAAQLKSETVRLELLGGESEALELPAGDATEETEGKTESE